MRRRYGSYGKGGLVPIGSLILGVVRDAPRSDLDAVDEITWRRAVGVSVAARTRPTRIERGILWVRVASSAWAQELALLKTTVVKRLAEQGIEVRDVRFRVGEVKPPQRTPGDRVTTKQRPRAEIPGRLAETIERVADDDLRRVITEAAAHNLAWQEALVAAAISKPRGARALRSSARGTAPLAPAPAGPSAKRGTRGAR